MIVRLCALCLAGAILSGCAMPPQGGYGYAPYALKPVYSSQRAYDLNMPSGYGYVQDPRAPSQYNRYMRSYGY